MSDFIQRLLPYYKAKMTKRVRLDFYDYITYNYKKAYKTVKREIEDAKNNSL